MAPLGPRPPVGGPGAAPTDGRVVVLGGSIAGLATALALARAGRQVQVIERDPAPADPAADPFLAWPRRGVPQFRLPHGFSARARNLLAERTPDVLDRLRASGVGEINLFKHFVPPERWEPADDAFTNIWTRRPVLELALRMTAEAEPGIMFHCPAIATGMRFAPTPDGPPRVLGVELADGRFVEADLVLDCAGQRTPVPRWLATRGIDVPTDVQDCETVYYSRYYRFTPGSELPRLSVATLRGEFPLGSWIGFAGDDDTYAFALECHPGTPGARKLRDVASWEAATRAIPALAPWVDPRNGTPLDDIQVMAGNRNLRRHYLSEGRPVVVGLLPVGDALCSTNPAYGWGSAMALTYAYAAADAIVAHAPDLAAVARAYDATSAAEADAVYREAAAMDRARSYRLTGRPVPEHDRAEMARQDEIMAALAGGVLRDVELGRAFNRRVNLVGPAAVVLGGDDLLHHARRARTPTEPSLTAAHHPTS
ncbi:FAD-dependent oxidoreductase [Micromonospora sp. RTGN7]|uniref:FAD-dependent oxidoreductase n=1 Tax=Micromonospora sp. RTGN7 TaxID=3016526 RepID=UPI0029FF3ECC|nr:FAD-dependent oxidoreductase [Micromonospora sp. RTGN7]